MGSCGLLPQQGRDSRSYFPVVECLIMSFSLVFFLPGSFIAYTGILPLLIVSEPSGPRNLWVYGGMTVAKIFMFCFFMYLFTVDRGEFYEFRQGN